MTQLIRVQSATPLMPPRIRVVFTNGEQREIDLTPYIASGPIFEPVRTDPTFFQSVAVDGGTLTWPNGADIDFGQYILWSYQMVYTHCTVELVKDGS
ncbi:DUF2442 domain-containing protein [Candidatus Chloroploca sp. M-50]|uniref:DUF2442 domain-containing protein n=1 Tax=Candidatus Chloroploca mongolica TaxID=2528176 RepID=A0ABS4DGN1_9CHLR|nr:DUF2442 domain-containing protein [Candidatus Chloroploca mongolica]MBP1468606.1 DUF2442 domain-containing protein [Candidatus Chloroploca mongolica]